MDIDIKTDKHSTSTIVHISGRIDAATSDTLEDTIMDILDTGENRIILNLSDTNYISSAGLRVLVVVSKQLQEAGQFCLCSLNDNVREIIEMSGFNTFIDIYEDYGTAQSAIDENY